MSWGVLAVKFLTGWWRWRHLPSKCWSYSCEHALVITKCGTKLVLKIVLTLNITWFLQAYSMTYGADYFLYVLFTWSSHIFQIDSSISNGYYSVAVLCRNTRKRLSQKPLKRDCIRTATRYDLQRAKKEMVLASKHGTKSSQNTKH